MSYILASLNLSTQLSLNELDTDVEGLGKKTIAEIVDGLTPSDRNQIMASHQLLLMQYRTFCDKLLIDAKKLDAKKFDDDEFIAHYEFMEQVKEANRVATLLQHIYKHYLNVQRLADSLTKDKRVFHYLLPREDWINADEKITGHVSSKIGYKIGRANFYRQTAARIRRLLAAISLFTAADSHYSLYLSTINIAVAPLMSYLAWLIFLPRLFNNFMMIFKHVVPHDGMSEEEKSLGWFLRLKIQLAQRWPDLANDIPWLILGLLNCFLLVNGLLPVAIYLNFALQFYDVIIAAIRIYADFTKYQDLLTKHEALLAEKEPGTEEHENLLSFISKLKEHIAVEKKALILSLVNAALIFISLIFTIALLATNPALALVGGAIAVATSILVYIGMEYIKKIRPDPKVSDLKGFFAPPKDPELLTPKRRRLPSQGSDPMLNSSRSFGNFTPNVIMVPC